MAKARTGGIIVALALALLTAACTPSTTNVNGQSGAVDPKTADPLTTGDNINTNLAYAPTGTATGKLAVILSGTSASTLGFKELTGALSSAGFHVIVLRYSNAVGTQQACPDANALTDPDCHRAFRSEVVFGGGIADPTGHAYDQAGVTVSKADSVANRLLKLVDYLRTTYPTAGWDQFQQRTGGTCNSVNTTYGACDLDWQRVVAVGHSQGAGVGLYLGKFFPLDKVVMLSGSYDAYDLGGGAYTAAPWIAEGGFAMAMADVRSLTHLADTGLGRIRSVEDALGVAGPEVSATSSPPYGGSHRLVTSLASTCPWDSVPGHNSTAVDVCVPDYAYLNAWVYLATS